MLARIIVDDAQADVVRARAFGRMMRGIAQNTMLPTVDFVVPPPVAWSTKSP